MKSLHQLKFEQFAEVQRYRTLVADAVRTKVVPHSGAIGALLTGSVARGDARRGPFGLYIDLAVVVEHRQDFDPTQVFGPTVEPYIPKHCVKVDDVGIAVELVTRNDLQDIRSRPESEIFAKQESIILYDSSGFLREWKETAFAITDEQKRQRALQCFFRLQYLVGEYRVEKWKHRSAWTQLCQIGNEAAECYCSFLHCVNGSFVPRKDWLVYLTYELGDKPPDHTSLLEAIYTSAPSEEPVASQFLHLSQALNWMSSYCDARKWIS